MQDTRLIKESENITRLNLCELENNLGETLNAVAKSLDRIIIQHEGKDIAVIVPIEDLALIEEMEDRIDVEAAEAAIAEEGDNISLAELKAELGL
jgi:prevent-host-death family protein